MIIRFVAKNLLSFKEETEFNLLPNRTQRLNHHKVSHNGIDFLRISAIYGANGAGKSNVIKSISLLEDIVEDGVIPNSIEDLKFKLSGENTNKPISVAVEFFTASKIYYYSLTFDKNIILNEELFESNAADDKLVFRRDIEDGNQRITFFDEYMNNEKRKLFVEVLSEKLVRKNEVLLSFIGTKYREDQELSDVINAYDWFDKELVIITPDAKPGGITHFLDTDPGLSAFANDFLPTLNTGISQLAIEKKKVNEQFELDDLDSIKEVIERAKNNPKAVALFLNSKTGEEITIATENGEIVAKRLVPKHLNNQGELVSFNLKMESDGTQRLIDYIPAFNGIINKARVYLIDEIERSIHPITIKEILSKISLDEKAKGQLIFTTHESCLLDQEILRPDEIWFAQKDIDGASRLYSLSDFNIHNTANIENGYLNGRYGGIPFLSNLQDLNWNKYGVSEQE